MVLGSSQAAKRARDELRVDPVTMAGLPVKSSTSEKYLGDHIAETNVTDSADLTIQTRIRAVAGPIAEIISLANDVKSSYIGPVSTALILWESIIVADEL